MKCILAKYSDLLLYKKTVNMDKLYDELLVELECPNCLTYMSPPIHQCCSGHSFCDSCRKKLPNCLLCKGVFTDLRNYSLEGLARKMHYPCVNNKFGCPVRLNIDDRAAHEFQCTFKRYQCCYSKCTWKGKYDEILEHWSQKKVSSKPYQDSNVCHTKIQKTDAFYVNLVRAHNELFWYKFKYQGGKLYWVVQYIGPLEKSSNFHFEIELFKPGQPLRKLLMSEYCQPIDMDQRELFTVGASVMTTIDAVSHLFGDDQLLIYYMRVKEVKANMQRDHSVSRESLRDENSGAIRKKYPPKTTERRRFVK